MKKTFKRETKQPILEPKSKDLPLRDDFSDISKHADVRIGSPLPLGTQERVEVDDSQPFTLVEVCIFGDVDAEGAHQWLLGP